LHRRSKGKGTIKKKKKLSRSGHIGRKRKKEFVLDKRPGRVWIVET